MVYRVCVEKKPGLAPECASLLSDCRSFLDLRGLANVRIWNRYDVEGIDEALFAYATNTVFSEPQLDSGRSDGVILRDRRIRRCRRLRRRAPARSVRPARRQRGPVHPAFESGRASAHPHGEGLRALRHAL